MFHSAKLAKAQQDAADAIARAETAENELAKLKAEIAATAAQAAAASMPEDEDKPEGEECEDKPEVTEDGEEMEPEAHLASISASVATLTAKIGELEQAQAGMDKAIEAKVSATFAAMGIDPIARAPGGADGTKDGNNAASLKGVKRLAAASAPKTA